MEEEEEEEEEGRTSPVGNLSCKDGKWWL